VRILGDGTQEFTTHVTNRLQEELGVITTSFAPIGVVVGGEAARVIIGSILMDIAYLVYSSGMLHISPLSNLGAITLM
jgi:hypothetical protein